MHCPYCDAEESRVVDSRLAADGCQVRRRRECPACGARFTTVEEAQLKLPLVVKSNGAREPFNADKLRQGMTLSLQNRPIAAEKIETAISHIVREMRGFGEGEVPSRRIGEWVMQELKILDQVAYVRFASVYRRFEDVQEFQQEIERLETELAPGTEVQLSLLKTGK